MAALSPTVGDVTPIGNTNSTTVLAIGEAVTQLQPVYRKSADGLYWKATNAGTLEQATVSGVAFTKAATATVDYTHVVTSGEMAAGTTVVEGTEYCVGVTEGTIVPKSDLAPGDRYTRIGYGKTTTTLQIDIGNTGVVMP